jgi:hypothetical protein
VEISYCHIAIAKIVNKNESNTLLDEKL